MVEAIADFELEIDRLVFGGGVVSSIEDLSFSQVENNTVIASHDRELAVVQNTSASELEAGDNFIFA